MYGNDVMTVRLVEKWCSRSKNVGTDIHHHDDTGWPFCVKDGYESAARMGGLILENRRVAI
jgi:hypothetical protein